ncbi:hypothetical protein ACRRVD_03260 [Candidatus Cardinium hertigii]|uniref:hypothetical protein n=1 Tax=Candidatus Cardinium hertigii TaxID=247481 RepID=UPI003D7DF7DE
MFTIPKDRLISWWNTNIRHQEDNNLYIVDNKGNNSYYDTQDHLTLVMYTGSYNTENSTTVSLNSVFPSLVVDPKENIIFHYCDLLSHAIDWDCAIYMNEIIQNYDNARLVIAISCNNLTKINFENSSFYTYVSMFRNKVNLPLLDRLDIGVITFDNKYNCIGISKENIQSTIASLFQEPNNKPTTSRVIFSFDQKKIFKFFFETYNRGDKDVFVLNTPDSAIALDNTIITQNDRNISNLVNVLCTNIQETLIEEIKNNILSIENRSNNFQEIINQLEKGINMLVKIKSELDSSSVRTKFFLNKVVTNFNGTISNESLSYVTHSDEIIEILMDIHNYSCIDNEDISDKNTCKLSECNFLKGLEDVINDLNIVKNWYIFLNELYTWLSEYYVQKDTHRYKDVLNHVQAEIEIFLNANATVDINNVIHQFAINFASNSDRLKKTGIIDTVPLNPRRLTFLNKTLDWTLKNTTKFSCDNESLVVKGKYIRISDIKEYKKYNCSEKSKNITILALDKTFIDTSLNETGINLYIISPKLEVIGNHQIILDGEPGVDHSNKIARKPIGPGSRGNDGLPGLPGGSAGNILVIGKTFINSSNLTISANGGKGGKGQDGSDGNGGKDGIPPKIPLDKNYSVRILESILSYANCYREDGNGGKEEKKIRVPLINYYYNECVTGDIKLCKSSDIDDCKQVLQYTFLNKKINYNKCNRINCTEYNIYGKNGTQGGYGGNGGSGGSGGYLGIVNIIGLGTEPEIIVNSSLGFQGEHGIGGKGGIGGRNGDVIRVGYIMVHYNNLSDNLCYSYWEKINQKPSNLFALPGSPGVDGNNTDRIREPEQVVGYPADAINTYKRYARENLVGNINESNLKSFLSDLDYNKDIRNLYDVPSLVNDFQILEEDYAKLNKNISFLPFYQYLLDRVYEYSDNMTLYESCSDKKEVLRYLALALLSKIDRYYQSELIVNTSSYLNRILVDIKNLEDIEYIYSLDQSIKKYNQEIDRDINLAKSFIEQLKEETLQNIDDIQSKNTLLINDTLKFIFDNQDNLYEKKSIIKKIKNLLNLKQFLYFIETGTLFVVLSSGLANSTILLIESGFNIGIGLISSELDISKEKNKILNTLNNLNEYNLLIKNKILIPIISLKDLLENTEKKLKNFNENYSNQENIIELKSNISYYNKELENKISEIKNIKYISYNLLNTTEETIKLFYTNISNIYKNIDIYKDINFEDFLFIVNNFKNSLIVFQESYDIYNEIKNDNEKISKFSNFINIIHDTKDVLYNNKNYAYKIIFPNIENINIFISKIEKSLKKNYHINIYMLNWEIKKYFKYFKYEIEKIYKLFDKKEEIFFYIEKLQESIFKTIEIYDNIKYYERDKSYAYLIKQVSSDKGLESCIKNSDLKNILDRLKVTIQTNLILNKYEIFINGFEQKYLGFSHLYIKKNNLPDSIQINKNDINNLVKYFIKNVVEDLKKNLDDYSNFIKNGTNKYIHINGEFNNKLHGTQRAFFVWNGHENKIIMEDLLSGRGVILKSDIRNGVDQYLVKYKKIHIGFKLNLLNSSESDQINFYKSLADFNIVMQDLGDHHYKCHNKIFIIKNSPTYMSYTFDRTGDGIPKDKSYHTTTIENNDSFLSPYTTWYVKIDSKYRNSNFSTLEKYKNHIIDLELEGIAEYIEFKSGEEVCNNLDYSYLPDHTIVEDIVLTRTSDQIHNHRKRRSIDPYHDVEEFQPVTSGSSSNMDKSIIKNIADLLGRSLMSFNPISRISNWFSKGRNNVYQESLNMLDNNLLYVKMINIEYYSIELPPSLPRISDNKSSTNINSIENNLVSNSTLL